jgi:nitroreductase
MTVREAIYARRSIRKFQDKPVEKETLLELARLGAAGPTATNRCPWVFVIVDEAEGMEKLRHATMFGKFNAPASIIVCGNMKKTLPLYAKDYWIQDCSAAMENILLGAVDIGLGAVWLGVTPIKQAVGKMSKALNLPDHIVPLGVAYIGYPDEEKEPRTQFTDDMVIWYQ